MTKTFDHLILIGRPACGKSEFIDFMKRLSEEERKEKFHIGKISELDDFVWLWKKFEEDDVWEKVAGKRLYSKISEHAYVVNSSELVEFLMEKFNYEVEQKFLSNKEFYNDSSVFIEFARGSKQDGGYKKALGLLSKELLERAAILYIDVSYEESRRRNQARYEEKLKHSILAHKVPEEDFVRFSSETDWPQLTEEKGSGYLEMNDLKVPFVTMHNEPELLPGPEIAERYKTALNKLFDL